MSKPGLPHYAVGEIIKGFGRGSKQLGIPTANYPNSVVEELPETLDTGIYFGYAQLDSKVHKMVMSIGWNPFYKNKTKSMETHIIHEFNEDLYGKILKVAIIGYLRPETTFNSLEELITAIKKDIQDAADKLDEPDYMKYRNDSFFKEG